MDTIFLDPWFTVVSILHEELPVDMNFCSILAQLALKTNFVTSATWNSYLQPEHSCSVRLEWRSSVGLIAVFQNHMGQPLTDAPLSVISHPGLRTAQPLWLTVTSFVEFSTVNTNLVHCLCFLLLFSQPNFSLPVDLDFRSTLAQTAGTQERFRDVYHVEIVSNKSAQSVVQSSNGHGCLVGRVRCGLRLRRHLIVATWNKAFCQPQHL